MSAAGVSLAAAIADAERLLRSDPAEAAKLARAILTAIPGNIEASLILARTLRLAGRLQEASALLGPLAQQSQPDVRVLLETGAVHDAIGDAAKTAAHYAEASKRMPENPRIWVVLGNALKTLGRQQESVSAYRQAIARDPSCGEAYWGIANLKTSRFDRNDIVSMKEQLARTGLSDKDRTELEFAIGKALGDAGEFGESFAHYVRANALARVREPYETSPTRDFIARLKETMTAEFFAARHGSGTKAGDPIFVVGMPRSGSTLVEQILASHSAVEGTKELRHIAQLAAGLGPWTKDSGKPAYPELLITLTPEQLVALGDAYLSRARIHRAAGRPRFVDKMPANFRHVGFIHLIAPNAKIIDVRRHPMACGLSCFTHHFASGQTPFYNLEDIGQYYRDYVGLMAHWDEALPGRVHRVQYEELVADPETKVRQLLDYCGLPFEESCLRFYENVRAVHTPSSQQVRQPIYSDALDYWRNYGPWLGALKDALGATNR